MFKRILILSVATPPDWLLAKLQRLVGGQDLSLRLELFPASPSLISRFYQSDAQVERVAEALSEQWRQQAGIDEELFEAQQLSIEINAQPLTLDAVLEAVARFEPDLVVKACRRHHRLDQYLLGHIDWQLIRGLAIPVMLLRPQAWPQNLSVSAAVDPVRAHHQPEALDEMIVERASAVAQMLAASVDLVHVYQPLPAAVILDDSLMLDYNLLKQRMEEEHRDAMSRFVDHMGLPESTQITLIKGEPALELPRYCAEHESSLVVMGAVDRVGLDELFIGSTTETVLEQLDGDLLVVPAAGILNPV